MLYRPNNTIIYYVILPLLIGVIGICLFQYAVDAQLSQNTLESIEDQTNVLSSAQVKVGDAPSFIEPYENAMYVANSGSDPDAENGIISVIDPNTNKVTENITVGEDPVFIESYERHFLDHDIYGIYVSNSANDTVSVIDPKTNTVTKNIIVGNYPEFIKVVGRDIYVANSGYPGSISVINPNKNNTVIKDIAADGPSFIESYQRGVKDEDGRDIYDIYVANSDNDTISVIDRSKNNTVIKNIIVGDNPRFIFPFKKFLYVANLGGDGVDGTISVIDPTKNNTVIKNITTVGDEPRFMESFQDNIYVANSESNTVSVINGTTNTVIKNITVGEGPSFLVLNGVDSLYVANYDSGSVSVINPLTNEVVAGVTFDSKPISAGKIICNGSKIPINRFFYLPSGAECIAQPNNGFEFGSWTQSLPGNATAIINASTPSDSPFPALTNAFSDDPAATLTVSRFGNFNAYFNSAPPPVPEGIWIALFSILLGTFMPSIIRWINGWRQRKRFYSYMKKLSLKYEEKGRQGTEDEIAELYATGKINDSQLKILKDKITEYFDRANKHPEGSDKINSSHETLTDRETN